MRGAVHLVDDQNHVVGAFTVKGKRAEMFAHALAETRTRDDENQKRGVIDLLVSNFVVVCAQLGVDAGRVDNLQSVPLVRRRSLRRYPRADFNLRAREHFDEAGLARAELPDENQFDFAAVVGKIFREA